MTTSSEGEWELQLGPIEGTDFKWALSRDGRLEVWEVGGPGDGHPSHYDYLKQAWGRNHDPFEGDVVGNMIVDDHTVTITAYYTAQAPTQIVTWARARFPTHHVKPQG